MQYQVSCSPLWASAGARSSQSTNGCRDEEKHNCAERCVDDRGHNSGTEMNSQFRKKPVANEGTDNPDDEISKDAEAGALYDLTSKPSGDETDDQ